MSRADTERARTFVERADADLAAVHALERVDCVPDEVVGFHGQQAAGKLLDAVLAAHRIGFPIDFPRTRRTATRELLDRLRAWVVAHFS